MKRIIGILLVLVMVFGMTTFSFAEDDISEDVNDYSWELSQIDGSPMRERWSYTIATSQGCFVDNGEYIGNASVSGKSNVTKVVIFMYPQKKSGDGWTNLTTFQDTRKGKSLSVEHYYSPCARGTYRTRCSFYVYVGDTFEHIIAYSSEYTY